jgi:hypothetical protein
MKKNMRVQDNIEQSGQTAMPDSYYTFLDKVIIHGVVNRQDDLLIFNRLGV